jgi:hypothetical protein
VELPGAVVVARKAAPLLLTVITMQLLRITSPSIAGWMWIKRGTCRRASRWSEPAKNAISMPPLG